MHTIHHKTRHLLLPLLIALPMMTANAADTTVISQTAAGLQGNNHSFGTSSVSADGRFVAFQSTASNLVTTNTFGLPHIFVHDKQTGQNSLVSVNSAGALANNDSFDPTISADGRFVAFNSLATNLVSGDGNGQIDTFIRDLQTGVTTRVSVSSTGIEGNSSSRHPPALSADGRFVAFTSWAGNLVADDSNGQIDVFVRDRQSSKTTRVSVGNANIQANNHSDSWPSISADGRYVAFSSNATNFGNTLDYNGQNIFVRDRVQNTTSLVSPRILTFGGSMSADMPSISADGRFVVFKSSNDNVIAGDNNARIDTFIRDRVTGSTSLISVSSAGVQGNGNSSSAYPAVISANGRFVAFVSDASNLVNGDSNAKEDVFVRDLLAHTTVRASASPTGVQANSGGSAPDINADGRFITFASGASNLLAVSDSNAKTDIFMRDRLLTAAKIADVQVLASVEPALVQKNIASTYSFTVTNNGAITATAVSLIDVFANGVPVSFTTSQGSCKKTSINVCNLGNLAPGGSVTITAVIKAVKSPFVQQISVNAAPLDHITVNNNLIISTPVTP